MKIQRHRTDYDSRPRSLLGALSVCIVLLNSPTTVSADTSRESVSASVPLGGLDLTNPAHLNIARERIAAAAKRLCMTFYDARRADNHEMFVDCYSKSVADALERLGTRLTVARTEPSAVPQRDP